MAKPVTGSSSLDQPSHKTSLDSPPATSPLWDMISCIFRCCCCQSRAAPQPIKQAQMRGSDSVARLGYIMPSSSTRVKYAIPNSSSQESFAVGSQEMCLYDLLKNMDFEEVRKVITAHKKLLSQEQITKLNTLLDAMQKSDPFLDPNILNKKIKNIPLAVFQEICENAFIAKIADNDDQRASTSSKRSDSLQRVQRRLDINYVIPSNEVFSDFMNRSPATLQEQALFIRWVARKYDERYRPDFLPPREDDEDEMEIPQERKESFEENVSFNFSNINEDPSQEILMEESVERGGDLLRS
jgi:hypothetical protein